MQAGAFAPRPSPQFPPAVRAVVCDFLADISEEVGTDQSTEALRDRTATMRDVWCVMRKLHECDQKLSLTMGGRLYGQYMKKMSYDYLLPEAARLVLAETTPPVPSRRREPPHVYGQLPKELRRQIRRALARYNKTLDEEVEELPPEWWKAAFCTWWLAERTDLQCMYIERPAMEAEAAKLRDGLPALTADEQEVVDRAVDSEVRPKGGRAPTPPEAADEPEEEAPAPSQHPRPPTAVADSVARPPARKKQRKEPAPAPAPKPEPANEAS